MSNSPIDELARLHSEMMQAVNASPMDESVYKEAVRQFEEFASINTPAIVAERNSWIAARDEWCERAQRMGERAAKAEQQLTERDAEIERLSLQYDRLVDSTGAEVEELRAEVERLREDRDFWKSQYDAIPSPAE